MLIMLLWILMMSILWCQKCQGEQRTDCQKDARTLLEKMETKKPNLNPAERNKIEIIWKHLVSDISLSCLQKIELEDRYGKIFEKEDKYDQIKKKIPFIIDFDICKKETEDNNMFRIKFSLAGLERSVVSKHGEYKVPDYFQRKKTPPYCFSGNNVSLALMENMAVPSIYKSCFRTVEICECYPAKKDCINGSCVRHEYHYDDDKDMIIERQIKNIEVNILRLEYSRVHTIKRTLLLEKIYLNLTLDHCDKFFSVKSLVGGMISPVITIVSVVGGVAVIVVILSCITCKNRKKRQDDVVDTNPDYGYYYEGVEYQESAIRDTNEYYAEEGEDEE